MSQSIRPIYAGLLGGILAAMIVSLSLYTTLPQAYTEGWYSPLSTQITTFAPTGVGTPIWPIPSLAELLCYFGGALVVIATGFLAARWEGGTIRQRLIAGIVAGLTTGLVVWLSVGAGAAGVVGHAPIWYNGPKSVDSDKMLILLNEAIVRTAWLVPISLAVIVGTATLLGGLGGLLGIRQGLSKPGTLRPISPATKLRIALSLLLSTTITLIIVGGVLTLLEAKVGDVATKVRHQLSFPATGITSIPTYMLLAVAVGLSWWIWRLVPVNGMQHWYSLGTLAGGGVIVLQIGIVGFLALINPQLVVQPVVASDLVAVALTSGVGLPLALRTRRRSDAPPEPITVWHDWLDSLAITTLGGATILMAGIGAFALSLVSGAIVFIDPLSGPMTGGIDAMPTVAGSIRNIYGTCFTAGILSLLYPLAPLSTFLVYEVLRHAYGRVREWWIWVVASLSGLFTGVLIGGGVGCLLSIAFSNLNSLSSWCIPVGMVTFGLVGLAGGQGIALGIPTHHMRRWIWTSVVSGALTISILTACYALKWWPLAATIVVLALCIVVLFQWRVSHGLYHWSRWWTLVNLAGAVAGYLAGLAITMGSNFLLALLLMPIVYAITTGTFLVRVGALDENLRQQVATVWSRASIRRKVLLLPGIFVVFALAASLIGFQIGSSETRVQLFQQQLKGDEPRVVAAVAERDRTLHESVTELADATMLRASLAPNNQATVRTATERANELRVRYDLTQVILTTGDGRAVFSVAEPTGSDSIWHWTLIDTAQPEQRALLTCHPGDAVQLINVPNMRTNPNLPQIGTDNKPIPMLIACATLDDGAGTVFAILDLDHARTHITQQSQIQSGLNLTFKISSPPSAIDDIPQISRSVFGETLILDLTLGVPIQATLTASTKQLSEIVAVGFRSMLIASLVSLAALLILGGWLGRSFTRSIIQITDAALAVSNGDLGQQVVIKTQDEIGNLARAFNTMVAGLRDREAAVKQREAAESANRAKSMFLANMSHELRTPLNAILGFAQLLLRDRGLSADQRDSLHVIGRSGEHLLALINDVLEMAKIEAGRVELREERFDLLRFLEDLEEMFQVRATDKGLQMIFDPSPGTPHYIRADKGKLRQILINLIGNAVKFTSEGGVTLRVDLRTSGSHPRLVCEIEDTGPGMSPEEISAIFESFVQTTSGRLSQEGTGLGLAISRQFVSLMGGELTVQSRVGQGSIFGLRLPVDVVNAPEEAVAHIGEVVGLAPDQPTFRILVVEDKWYNRHLLLKLLSSLGFVVREATNGAEGIAVWHEWQPQLIFMDMRMPIMDGYEATRTIKQSERGHETIVIALTASAFEEDRNQVLSAGCDEFIRKPFRNDQLFAALERHLGVRFMRESGEPAATVTPKPSDMLAPLDLTVLPLGTLAELRSAAEQADGEAVLQIIAPFAALHSTQVHTITNLVDNFRFDALLDAATDASQDQPQGTQL
ncbi:MAG: ATP-binding protein [Chloroflexales bacterium]